MALRKRTRLIIFLIIAAIPILLAEVLLSRWGQTAIARQVLKSVNADLAGELSLGSAHATLGGNVALRDLSLVDSLGEEIIFIDALDANLLLPSLLKHRLQVRTLLISGLRARVLIDSAGKTNIECAVASTPAPPPTDTLAGSAWSVSFEDVSIAGTALEIRTADTMLFDAKRFDISGRFSYVDSLVAYDVTLDADERLRLNARGDVALSRTPALSGEVGFMIDSIYTRAMPPPVNRLGEISGHVVYATGRDSIEASGFLRTPALGETKYVVALPYPELPPAGRATLDLVRVHPALLWDDTTHAAISGRLEFVREDDVQILSGWKVALDLSDVSYGPYDARTISGSVTTKDSTLTVTLDVHSPTGFASLTAVSAGLDPKSLSCTGSASLQKIDLRGLVPGLPDSLQPITGQAQFTLEMPASQLQRSMEATVQLEAVELGSLRLDSLYSHFALDGDSLQESSLWIDLPGIAVTASAVGTLDSLLVASMRIEIPECELAPALSLLHPALDTLSGAFQSDIIARVERPLDGSAVISATADLVLQRARYGDAAIDQLMTRILKFDSRTRETFAVVSVKGASYGHFGIDSVRAIVRGVPEAANTDLRIWARKDTLQFTGDIDWKLLGEPMQIMLHSANLLAYQNTWTLTQPAAIEFSDQHVTIDGLMTRSALGSVIATGTLSLDGEQDFVIELSGLQTAELSRVLKLQLPETTANLRAILTGTYDNLTGDVSVGTDTVRIDGVYVADGLNLAASVNELAATYTAFASWHGDTLFDAHGSLPVSLTFEKGLTLRESLPMSGTARLHEQSLALLGPFLPFGVRTGGMISAEAVVLGSPKLPSWYGTFRVHDAAYADARSGVDYSHINIIGDFSLDTLRVEQFSAESEGTVRGSGWVVMAFPLPNELHLDLNMAGFEVLNSPTLRLKATGDAKLEGPLTAINATGNIRVDEGLYRITQATGKQIEEIDLARELALLRGDTSVQKSFLVSELYEPMSHSIRVKVPGNLWLRGGGLNLELSGELSVNKLARSEPELVGEIKVIGGKAQYFGREFRVDPEVSTVRFTGSAENPSLNIRATYSKSESNTEIVILLEGTAEQTTMTLSGTRDGSALTAAEALYELTRGASGSTTLEGTVTTAGLGQVSSVVGQAIGVDVFEYHAGEGGLNDLSAGKLEVGTYLTDRLFVRVLQPVESIQTGQEVKVEFRLIDWLKLSAQQQGKERSLFELLLQWAWH